MIKKFYESFQDEDDDDPFKEDVPINKIPSHNTTLTIGDLIRKPDRRNVFKVIIENMHGDADAYTYVTMYINDSDKVIKVHDFCKYVAPLHDRLWREWERFFRDDEIDEFIQGDSTCDGEFSARPRVHKVTFFDSIGNEREVRIR